MRHTAKTTATVSSIAVILSTLTFSLPAISIAEEASVIAQGKALAFDRKKGNCLACHQIEGGSLPGNIGPPLVAMKARFPEKAKLQSQIWDSRQNNPKTIMPPFGPHEVLSKAEIEKVVEYIYSL